MPSYCLVGKPMIERNAKSPQLSIGLPLYNGGKYFAESLECFFAQSFADFELVICGNASTDGGEALWIAGRGASAGAASPRLSA